MEEDAGTLKKAKKYDADQNEEDDDDDGDRGDNQSTAKIASGVHIAYNPHTLPCASRGLIYSFSFPQRTS